MFNFHKLQKNSLFLSRTDFAKHDKGWDVGGGKTVEMKIYCLWKMGRNLDGGLSDISQDGN